MAAINQSVPMFHPMQAVSFVGGEGIIQNYKSEPGGWTYLIAMTLGPEPSFGRVGAEATVLLNEADLRAA
jgi:hypothetical protein